MLDIIIYDGIVGLMQRDVRLINNILARYDIDYRIHKFSGFNNKFKEVIQARGSFKIYLLDMQADGIKIASYIREYEVDSMIIFISNLDKRLKGLFNNKLMIFDYICYDNNYMNKLSDDIESIIRLYYRKKILSFKYNKIIYHITYSDINYIEKEPLIKRCIIHTLNNNYYIVNSVEKLTKILGINFIRTHQSCIVNVSNIEEIDCFNNAIRFKNGDETHLLTDKAKKILKEYVGKISI